MLKKKLMLKLARKLTNYRLCMAEIAKPEMPYFHLVLQGRKISIRLDQKEDNST